MHDFEECVKRLDLKPGDIVVMRFPHDITMDGLESVRNQWDSIAPDVKLLVLGAGGEIEVMHPMAEPTQGEPPCPHNYPNDGAPGLPCTCDEPAPLEVTE